MPSPPPSDRGGKTLTVVPRIPVGRSGESLVGRGAECAALDKLATDVRAGLSGSVVFLGEAGVGKTRLLHYLADSARDVTVVWTVGAQSELRLGFAALHRLVMPYLNRLDRLAGPHREALEVTFGLTVGPPPNRFLVSLAALALLSDVATDRPLVCLIDDAQWVDQESLAVLGFVARRLYADPIGMVFTAREHAGDLTPLDGLARRRIAALDPASAHILLEEAIAGALNSRVSERVITETGGNPLAMLELLGELSAEQLAGRFPLPRRLPVGHRVDAHFSAQVATLSSEARTILLIAAACADEKPSTVWRAGALLGVAVSMADPAVQQGIVVLQPCVAFRHPLIRAAVYNGATPEDRRRVHEALATVAHRDGEDDQAAWHRAAAVTAPDEDIATDLEASAVRAQRRGGYTMQAAFLTRAAELSVETGKGALRYLAAAQAHLAAGDGPLAEAVLDVATPGLDDADQAVAAPRLRAAISVFYSRHRDVPAMLLKAATKVHPTDKSLVRQILFDAMQAAIVARQYTVGTTLDEVARVVLDSARDPDLSRTGNDLLLDGFATRIARGYADAVPLLRAAVATMFTTQSVAHVDIPSTILGWFAADDVWDEHGRRAMFERAQAIERRQGALGAMRITLAGLSTSHAWAGEMNAAENRYGEAADISALIGVAPAATTGVLLEVRAWQGRESESRAVAASTAEWGRQQGAAILEIFALMGLTVLELGLGRYPEALQCALQILRDDPPGFGNRILPEVVEAGIRGGDRAAAESALERLTERAAAAATPWALGLLARSRALMAADEDAEVFYREAIDQLTGTAVRTELARAHLLYGEWLRRRKRRRDAEIQLRTAYEMFTSMGAAAFAARTRAERRASGHLGDDAPRAHQPFGLTPQETQVARQAGAGATNAEIASRLFVTTSTVEYHLGKIFRKLGVTSRRQLASALGAQTTTPASLDQLP
ncbi:MAG: transcriptional regulator, LuxR family [Mycobacterium sp.]|nr:transcriptional regulator, LuxR family [Mycobacterium sp.]